jgi:hypothetical protein
VSGGAWKRHDTSDDDLAADWWIVSAARDAIPAERVGERIVTVVRDDDDKTTGFRIGTEERARGRTSESRRILFIRDIDALIAIGGRGGTRQELALAWEQHIGVLPVPCFAGAAREFWEAYRSDLLIALGIDDDVARRWERVGSGSETGEALVAEMVDVLLKSLPRRSFVIMPFQAEFSGLYDTLIEPAIVAAGDDPIQLQRLGTPGDARKQLEDGIRHCEYAIAVLDGLRHNVLYEVGLAHGHHKVTILLNRLGSLNAGEVPFDLATQQRLEYSECDDGDRSRLTKLIRSIPLGRH